jgi:hypothetical protein
LVHRCRNPCRSAQTLKSTRHSRHRVPRPASRPASTVTSRPARASPSKELTCKSRASTAHVRWSTFSLGSLADRDFSMCLSAPKPSEVGVAPSGFIALFLTGWPVRLPCGADQCTMIRPFEV